MILHFFPEKPDPTNTVHSTLHPPAFKAITVADFNKHFSENFKSLYKRNSANIGRVLEFYKFMGARFFKKMDIENLKDCVNSKVFEGINNKADDIVNSSVDTISFFASLDVPELNDFLI